MEKTVKKKGNNRHKDETERENDHVCEGRKGETGHNDADHSVTPQTQHKRMSINQKEYYSQHILQQQHRQIRYTQLLYTIYKWLYIIELFLKHILSSDKTLICLFNMVITVSTVILKVQQQHHVLVTRIMGH